MWPRELCSRFIHVHRRRGKEEERGGEREREGEGTAQWVCLSKCAHVHWWVAVTAYLKQIYPLNLRNECTLSSSKGVP